MGIPILSRIEYDRKAGAWGQYTQAADLVRYHDTRQAAILAALSAELADWCQTLARRYPRLGRRPLKAAVIIAEAEKRVSQSTRFQGFYDVVGDSGRVYQVNVAAGACNCEDRRQGHYCKHLLACRYLEQKPQPTLWALTLKALEVNRNHPDYTGEVLWSGPGGRYAQLELEHTDSTASRISPATYLTLVVSGCVHRLRVAKLREGVMMSQYWHQIARRDDYDDWVKRVNHA